jgi:hypothetical protein
MHHHVHKEQPMATSVVTLAPSDAIAHKIVDRIRIEGIPSNSVSVLFPDKSTTKDFAHEKHTKAPEGATAGVTTGGVLGGALGWLVGIGSLAIPGVGPFIAAGPILAALSGAAIGATVGGITGTLIGLGFPEFEAKRYEGKIKDGRILISVEASDGKAVSLIKDIFKQEGGEDIAAVGESKVPAAKSPSAEQKKRESKTI